MIERKKKMLNTQEEHESDVVNPTPNAPESYSSNTLLSHVNQS